MEYFCCVLRRHLIKKFKDVNANALFNSFLVGSQFIFKNSFVPMWALIMVQWRFCCTDCNCKV